MNQEELSQVKQDIERLISDVKKIVTPDESSCCKEEEGKVVCHTLWNEHKRPMLCLGLTAIIGGIIGVMLTRKKS